MKLTLNIRGDEEEVSTGNSYSQSGTYKPYNNNKYRVVSTKATTLWNTENRPKLY